MIRPFLTRQSFILLALFLSLNFICSRLKAFQPSRPKNVLFIVVDDLRPTLGCYGDRYASTPHIDRLASEGVVFDKAYCQQAVCSPSRSSVLTGLRPDKLRVWGLSQPFRKTVPDAVTLPQFFKIHGYHTDAVGKIYHDPKTHQDSLSWSGKTRFTVTQNHPGHKYILPENLLQKKGASTERLPAEDSAYIDGKVAGAALKLLSEAKGKPFFLAVGFRRPHLPFTAPDKYWRLYDTVNFQGPVNPSPPLGAPSLAFHNSQELRGFTDIPKNGPLPPHIVQKLWHGYYASTSYVDTQIGKLMEALDHLGLRQNTIVVLWSDHGYHLGEQGLWCKSTNFENAVRVPLIISVPGIRSAGTHAYGLVELVDLYPTLLDLCGFPVPENLDGQSLRPVLNDPHIKVKDFALSQFVRPYESLFNDARIEVMGYSLRTENYRYTEWRSFGTDSIVATELYDHRSDPGETVNLAGAMKEDTLHRLKSKLAGIVKGQIVTERK